MNVGIFVGDIGRKLDISNVELGNPGVGGTEYLMFLLAHYLSKRLPNDKIYVFSKFSIISDIVKFNVVDNDENLAKNVDTYDIDILVVKSGISKELLKSLKGKNVKLIIWAHNYIFADTATFFAKNPLVKRVVFVGKQHYDRYIDHDLIAKSVYIYNMVPEADGLLKRDLSQLGVLYMGAIIPSKGFHLLARIWKSILEEVPEAHLYVMGSGNMYNTKISLGKFGIAEADYESLFMNYLTDENGKILESVHFLGTVKEDKKRIFSKTSVGVINPSARTETFGMGIIEMNRYGIPVVTLKKNGFLDTIVDGYTGALGNSITDIKDRIIYLLKNENENLRLGKNAQEWSKMFLPENIISQWVNLLLQIRDDNGEVVYIPPKNYLNNNAKWIRVINHFLRFNLKLKFLPSIISIETFAYNLMKKIR